VAIQGAAAAAAARLFLRRTLYAVGSTQSPGDGIFRGIRDAVWYQRRIKDVARGRIDKFIAAYARRAFYKAVSDSLRPRLSAKAKWHDREFAAWTSARRRVFLIQAAAYSRKTIKSSMKRAPSSPTVWSKKQRKYVRRRGRRSTRPLYSLPGRPPNYHRTPWATANLRSVVFTQPSPDNMEIALGTQPNWRTKHSSKAVPGLHEYGGMQVYLKARKPTSLSLGRDYGAWKSGKPAWAKYPPRPFMRPGLVKGVRAYIGKRKMQNVTAVGIKFGVVR